MALPWPERLLQLRECAPAKGPGGELLFRGLRVRVGVAWGVAGAAARVGRTLSLCWIVK